MCLIIIVLIIIIMFFWSDLGKSLLHLHPFNCSNICSGLDMIGCVLSYFEGQQFYTVTQAVHSLLYIVAKCHFFGYHMKNIIQYLQTCEGCTHFCEILCVYLYIYIYIHSKTTILFIMFLRDNKYFMLTKPAFIWSKYSKNSSPNFCIDCFLH